MQKSIKILVYILFCLCWIPIGLFVWIGMLIRVTLLFVSVSLIAAIGGRGRAVNFEETFERTSYFFINGFVSSYDALFGTTPPYPTGDISLGNFFKQFLLTLAFAASIIFCIQVKQHGLKNAADKVKKYITLWISGNNNTKQEQEKNAGL